MVLDFVDRVVAPLERLTHHTLLCAGGCEGCPFFRRGRGLSNSTHNTPGLGCIRVSREGSTLATPRQEAAKLKPRELERKWQRCWHNITTNMVHRHRNVSMLDHKLARTCLNGMLWRPYLHCLVILTWVPAFSPCCLLQVTKLTDRSLDKREAA